MAKTSIMAAQRAGQVISSDADSRGLRRAVTGQLQFLHDAAVNTQTGRWTAIKVRATSKGASQLVEPK